MVSPGPSHTHLERRVQKLTSILEVAKAMTSERDLNQLLDLILSEAVKVVEADRCTLFLLNREGNELCSKVAHGTPSELRVPLGSGIAGAVAQSGRSVNLQDAYSDLRFNPSYDVASGYRTKTLLTVP